MIYDCCLVESVAGNGAAAHWTCGVLYAAHCRHAAARRAPLARRRSHGLGPCLAFVWTLALGGFLLRSTLLAHQLSTMVSKSRVPTPAWLLAVIVPLLLIHIVIVAA